MEYKDKNLQALLDAFSSNPVDAFGSAKAELDLAKEKYENARLQLLDQKTFGKHKGDLFEANIIEVKETSRIDYKSLASSKRSMSSRPLTLPFMLLENVSAITAS